MMIKTAPLKQWEIRGVEEGSNIVDEKELRFPFLRVLLWEQSKIPMTKFQIPNKCQWFSD
jgi:hypothetical protein